MAPAHILIERIGENAKLVGELARMAVGDGRHHVEGAEGQGDGRRQVLRLLRLRPAHQGHALAPRAAMLRGRNEGILDLDLDVARRGRQAAPGRAQDHVRLRHRRSRPAGRRLAGRDRALAWKTKLAHVARRPICWRASRSAPTPRRSRLQANLKDLLLAAPAGPRVTMGLDPGIRTGVKVAVVDQTGKLRRHRHHLSARAAATTGMGSLATLAALCLKHKVDLDQRRQRHRRAARPTSWSPS